MKKKQRENVNNITPYSEHVSWQKRVQHENLGEQHSLLYALKMGYLNDSRSRQLSLPSLTKSRSLRSDLTTLAQ